MTESNLLTSWGSLKQKIICEKIYRPKVLFSDRCLKVTIIISTVTVIITIIIITIERYHQHPTNPNPFQSVWVFAAAGSHADRVGGKWPCRHFWSPPPPPLPPHHPPPTPPTLFFPPPYSSIYSPSPSPSSYITFAPASSRPQVILGWKMNSLWYTVVRNSKGPWFFHTQFLPAVWKHSFTLESKNSLIITITFSQTLTSYMSWCPPMIYKGSC